MTRPPSPAAHRSAAAWAATLAVLLLVPAGATPPAPPWVPAVFDQMGDKLVHAALFFGATRAFGRSSRALGVARPWTAAALAAIAYGGVLEVVQGFVGRDASWGDLVADAVGALLAASALPDWRRVEQ